MNVSHGLGARAVGALLILILSPRTTWAQQPTATTPPPGEPLTFDAAPPPAPSSATPEPSCPPRNAQLLTAQLVEIEQRAIALEEERARIRTVGLRVGKYISWTVFAVLASTAFGQFGRAQMIKEAVDDGRTDKYYDSDGDGDVDHDDEQRSRRVARGLFIGSMVPLGLGIYTTVVGRTRGRHIRALDTQLNDLRDRRRSVLKNLSVELGASNVQASLRMRLAF